MFYLSSLIKEICIYPKDLTFDIKNIISTKIRELEGTIIGNHGYIISILEFNQTSKGKVDNETGRVNYKISYKAITFKPIEGEIIYAYPITIIEHGFYCKVGNMQIFVTQHIMNGWKYNVEENIWIKDKELKNNKEFKCNKNNDNNDDNDDNDGDNEQDENSEDSEDSKDSEDNEDNEDNEYNEDNEDIIVKNNIVKLGTMLKIKIYAYRINSNEINALGEIV